MKWGRKWGNFWGADKVSPVKIFDYEELPPLAFVSWSSAAEGVLYHVYADGKYYDTTFGLEMVVQFQDFGRHWVEVFVGSKSSIDEDLSAFVTGIPGTRVKLSWTASPASDLDHYKIYQKIVSVWSNIGETKSDETEYITGVLVDGTYEFRVNPVDTAGNELTSGETKSITIARYPDAPTNLSLTNFDENTGIASFSFTPSGSPGVLGYRVYHNSGSGDIDYGTVQDTVLSSPFDLVLSAGVWDVGIRAYNVTYEEDNVDVFTSFELGGSPVDQLGERPNIPESLAVVPAAGGTFAVYCVYEAFQEKGKAATIRFYAGEGAVDYSAIVATATVPDHVQGEQAVLEIAATSSALTDGKTYTFGARAITSSGRESENADTAIGVCDASAPGDISSLVAEAVNYEESGEVEA